MQKPTDMTPQQAINYFPQSIREQFKIEISQGGNLWIRDVSINPAVIQLIEHSEKGKFYNIETTKDMSVYVHYDMNAIHVTQH